MIPKIIMILIRISIISNYEKKKKKNKKKGSKNNPFITLVKILKIKVHLDTLLREI
jgi:hypothetical protein